MTSAIHEWLPTDALDHPCVRALVDGAIARWARLWFASAGSEVAHWSVMGPGWRVPERQRPRELGHVAVAPTEWAVRSALELDRLSEELPDNDRPIIRSFEDRLIEDLASAIAGVLPLPPPDESERSVIDRLSAQGGAEIVVRGDGGISLLSVLLPLDVIAPTLRSALPPGRAADRALQSRSKALGSQRLRLSASLGQADISLSDVRGLAPGDVLILDRGLDEPADLSIVESGTLLARGNLDNIDGRMALIVKA